MTVRIAFVGAGGIASWQHFPNIEETSAQIDVVGICDLDEETAAEAGKRFDAATYADHETMYDDAEPDAAFVCVPPFAHGEPELAAAERGIDLLVEKPLGLARDTVREIDAAIAEHGVVSQVGYMNRYAPGVERAIELVGDRTVSLVDGRWFGQVAGTPWWGVEERSGGQIVEQATHIFDLVRRFGGDIETVAAYGGREVKAEAIDFADTTTTSMELDSGAVGHVSATSALDSYEQGETGVTIVGDGLRLECDLDGGLVGRVGDREVELADDTNPFRRELEEFVAAVEAGDPSRPRSPYADARRTFEVTLAVNESLESGAPVSLN
jgi:predicted dehydrogenase